jgi:hypothetical protein
LPVAWQVADDVVAPPAGEDLLVAGVVADERELGVDQVPDHRGRELSPR